MCIGFHVHVIWSFNMFKINNITPTFFAHAFPKKPEPEVELVIDKQMALQIQLKSVRFLVAQLSHLAIFAVSTTLFEPDRERVVDSVNVFHTLVKQVSSFSPSSDDSLQVRSFRKDKTGYRLSKVPAFGSKSVVVGETYEYIGQINDGIPDGFGVACSKLAHFDRIVNLDRDALIGVIANNSQIMVGFWEKGVPVGACAYMKTIIRYDVTIITKVGYFQNDIINGFGSEVKESYLKQNDNKWIQRTVKKVSQEQFDCDCCYQLIGHFDKGNLEGACSIKTQYKQIQGIKNDNRICYGEMSRNNGTGQGSIHYIMSFPPYVTILSQEGLFDNYKLSGLGKQNSQFGVSSAEHYSKYLLQINNQLSNSSQLHYVYEGEFKNGNPEGNGKLTFRQKEVYDGYFHTQAIQSKNYLLQVQGNIDKETGNGEGQIITFDLCQSKQLNTRSGKFISFMQHGAGTLKAQRAQSYEGNFEDNWPSGQGKIIAQWGFSNCPSTEGFFKTELQFDPIISCIQGDISPQTGNGRGKIFKYTLWTLDVAQVLEGEFTNFKIIQGGQKEKSFSFAGKNEPKVQKQPAVKDNQSQNIINEKQCLGLEKKSNGKQAKLEKVEVSQTIAKKKSLKKIEKDEKEAQLSVMQTKIQIRQLKQQSVLLILLVIALALW